MLRSLPGPLFLSVRIHATDARMGSRRRLKRIEDKLIEKEEKLVRKEGKLKQKWRKYNHKNVKLLKLIADQCV